MDVLYFLSPSKAHRPKWDASFLNLKLHHNWRSLFISRSLVKIENRRNACAMSLINESKRVSCFAETPSSSWTLDGFVLSNKCSVVLNIWDFKYPFPSLMFFLTKWGCHQRSLFPFMHTACVPVPRRTRGRFPWWQATQTDTVCQV